ncbi:hypothetical protein GW813_09700 [bacterium]|nr:hypothetical protein [bacterium]PJA74687.1 MAG: hypothetical protein CO151_08835 [bacterium CG_4_9_14_3_um_filter_65_15]
MSAKRQPTAVILADAHFHLRPDAAESRRIERFLELLEAIHGVDHLILLGDIFDFWFDYPHFRLDGYDEILQGLDGVRASGTTVHFVGGNHDIWAAGYLHRRFGSEPDGMPLDLQLGDLRVRFDHGDGLLSHDWLYQTFRTIVRTRAGILLAKSLHPEILFALSTWLSGHSRNASRDEGREIEAKASAWLGRQQDAPWDLIVIGHVHHRFTTTVQGRTMAAPTGWFNRLDLGVIQDGKFALLDFDQDTLPDFGSRETTLPGHSQ